MRRYIAVYEYNFYGIYTREIEFYSNHRANSKTNKADAMRKIREHYERGIWENAEVLYTYLAD